MKAMFERYSNINEAAGISIFIGADGQNAFNACTLKTEGSLVFIDQKVTDLKQADDLQKMIKPGAICSVNLTGRGVLHKKIKKTESINQNNFSEILPNAKISDFYMQHFISGEFSFVSVMRRADADQWIDKLAKFGFKPLMLSFGPFPVHQVVSQLNVYGGELIFNGHVIDRDENANWINYSFKEATRNPFSLKIESEQISEELIIPYAIAFQLILSAKIDVIAADHESLAAKLKQTLTDRQLRVNAFITLSFFLLVLLVNFAIFSSLNSRNSKLSVQLSSDSQSENSMREIKERIKAKERLLANLGWDGGINKSILLDQAAALIPPEIILSEAAVNPEDAASSRTQKSLVFFKREIFIKGFSENIAPVNEWMERLKTKGWLKTIQMESYHYNPEKSVGEFTVLITY